MCLHHARARALACMSAGGQESVEPARVARHRGSAAVVAAQPGCRQHAPRVRHAVVAAARGERRVGGAGLRGAAAGAVTPRRWGVGSHTTAGVAEGGAECGLRGAAEGGVECGLRGAAEGGVECGLRGVAEGGVECGLRGAAEGGVECGLRDAAAGGFGPLRGGGRLGSFSKNDLASVCAA
eukprot:364728-Chlamydomonas_euryale.AAC.11